MRSPLPFLLTLLLPVAASAVEPDPLAPQREAIRRGVQAVLACNGLFTSERTLEQVRRQELAYLRGRPFAEGVPPAPLRVREELRAVEVGTDDDGPVLRAVFREGIGCVVLAPGQSLEGLDALPALDRVPEPGHADEVPWPDGDAVPDEPLPAGVDAAALRAASDWAIERPTAEQDTLSLLVVHRGRLIHERYAPGVDRFTRTRTWSTAKSIAVTLIGMLVDRGVLELDAPLPVSWLPEGAQAPETDPRRAITLRHVLHMTSGLNPVDSGGREYVSGSGLSYWAGASSADGARARGLVRAPRTSWDYENHSPGH